MTQAGDARARADRRKEARRAARAGRRAARALAGRRPESRAGALRPVRAPEQALRQAEGESTQETHALSAQAGRQALEALRQAEQAAKRRYQAAEEAIEGLRCEWVDASHAVRSFERKTKKHGTQARKD